MQTPLPTEGIVKLCLEKCLRVRGQMNVHFEVSQLEVVSWTGLTDYFLLY